MGTYSTGVRGRAKPTFSTCVFSFILFGYLPYKSMYDKLVLQRYKTHCVRFLGANSVVYAQKISTKYNLYNRGNSHKGSFFVAIVYADSFCMEHFTNDSFYDRTYCSDYKLSPNPISNNNAHNGYFAILLCVVCVLVERLCLSC